MKERFYQGVIIVLLLFFTIFIVKSHENFMDLSDTNDELVALIDESRENNEEIVSKWKESYEDLQTDYGKLLSEYEQYKTSQKEVELPTYHFTEAEVYLIAQCVEAEAGGYEDHSKSQKYIAQVILNRLHSGSFPNSVEEVIYQKSGSVPQFSVAYNGMMDDLEVSSETLTNVYSVIVQGTDLPSYVLYFYSASVTENWVNTLNTYDTVEGTVFAYYKEDKENE